MTSNPSFSDLTTIGVGGPIEGFEEPDTRDEVIDAVRGADESHRPLCVIGGGSNMLVADDGFEGLVIRDARRGITMERDDASTPFAPSVKGRGRERTTLVRVQAGCHWDDFVRDMIAVSLGGVEGLSGVPGTVGASVVQNIGAYGQEVADSVECVETWDRLTGRIRILTNSELGFGYRMSALKRSMNDSYEGPCRFFPSPRYIVLSVTFRLRRDAVGTVGYAQLAKAVDVHVGDRLPIADIRAAVLAVRAEKGMLEDAHRYENPFMRGCVDDDGLRVALSAQIQGGDDGFSDEDRHSCGSFFMNPVLSSRQAALLPEDAPRFEVLSDDGNPAVKTSAAWLIDHAGFHRGFAVHEHARAALSTKHTLALTNRGGARAHDIVELARAILQGVDESFGVHLVPEPVIVGLALD